MDAPRASLAAIVASGVALAQTTARVSVGPSGVEANARSLWSALSADGNRVAFISLASNLVAGDTNGKDDVFVHDRAAATTQRVSVSTSGAQADDHSTGVAISGNGRIVAFTSDATTLITGDLNFSQDIFARDLVTGVTELVTRSYTGGASDGSAGVRAVSNDGRFVAFDSGATNLVPNDTNLKTDVFVRDRIAGTNERISVATGGAQGNSHSVCAALSSDGNLAAFASGSTNFFVGDANNVDDVFLRDRAAGTTELISLSSSGTQGNGASYDVTISGDGRFVAFLSYASNLVPGDANGDADGFVRDRQLGTTQMVSVALTPAGANAQVSYPTVSADGRSVAFYSVANNLVPGDTNGCNDVFVRDLVTATTSRVDLTAGGAQGLGPCSGFCPLGISSNGRFVAFFSAKNNLVAGDTNGTLDVFVRDRGAIVPTVYCTAGTTTHGCVPSIAVTGLPSASASSGFTLTVTALEGQRSGLIFYGIHGEVAVPWSSTSTSFLCVKSPTQRTPAQSSGGTLNACNGSLSIDFLAFLAAHPGALGQPFAAGQLVNAQAWFRDPPAPKTTNLSDAVGFLMFP